VTYSSLSELPQAIKELNPNIFTPKLQTETKKDRHNKYNAKKTMYNGVLYDSRGESEKAQQLDLELRAGTVLWWCRQPRFVLQGGVEYVADFIVQRPAGIVEVVDFKGMKTAEYKLKKKQVEARYRLKVKEETK
jgi:hypothetical protein